MFENENVTVPLLRTVRVQQPRECIIIVLHLNFQAQNDNSYLIANNFFFRI